MTEVEKFQWAFQIVVIICFTVALVKGYWGDGAGWLLLIFFLSAL